MWLSNENTTIYSGLQLSNKRTIIQVQKITQFVFKREEVHMKKSECKNSDYKGEIISMVNAIDDLPTLRKIWAFIRLLFLK